MKADRETFDSAAARSTAFRTPEDQVRDIRIVRFFDFMFY